MGSGDETSRKFFKLTDAVDEFQYLLDTNLSTLLHFFSACDIVISSKCSQLPKRKKCLCLFKSNTSVNILPVPKYVVSNFTCVTETYGFPFVTSLFPWLSLLSPSVHLNQGATIAEHYIRCIFLLNHFS
jgi:hypothetical protein